MAIGRHKSKSASKPRRTHGGVLRDKSLGTKVSGVEYDRIVNATGTLSPGEWLRGVAIRAAERPVPIDEVILTELLATQRLLVNLFGLIAADQKEPLTAGVIKTLLAEVDDDKLHRAHKRLRMEMSHG